MVDPWPDVKETPRPNWIVNAQEIHKLVSDKSPQTIPVVGRFICSRDEDEDRMVALLLERGLTALDSDQCEIVASKIVATNEMAIREEIENMRRLAKELGYRLISVEAGDFEGGNAVILASEDGYIPWWQN